MRQKKQNNNPKLISTQSSVLFSEKTFSASANGGCIVLFQTDECLLCRLCFSIMPFKRIKASFCLPLATVTPPLAREAVLLFASVYRGFQSFFKLSRFLDIFLFNKKRKTLQNVSEQTGIIPAASLSQPHCLSEWRHSSFA